MLSEEGISGEKFLLITVRAGISVWLCCVFIVALWCLSCGTQA